MNAYVLDYAERYAAKAVKLGEERGEARGEARGEVRGAARGREEQAKATALTMHKLGMTVELIAQYIGFDQAVVKEWLAQA